ncbi:esterase [Altererythrobacter indicus]|uniref:Esterase n=1 Tax=Altericroceibacterium indicum TaxID=374177 RepID=A0A845ADS7_9SPHN|nr:alpha/beta hydrolase-fold protein [Altericroceibacterium indicum]MXP27131.1 esterase [Altericroceibacterium indicum]
MKPIHFISGGLLSFALTLALGQPALAQDHGAQSCAPQGFFAMPDYQSVEIHDDGRVTFRMCAPDARDVRVISSDVAEVIPMGFPPGSPVGLPMQKGPGGLWSVTTDKPFPADTYRFNFQVDGVRVPDPLATNFSEERIGVDSVMEVPGPAGAFQAYHKDVPHGAVSTVHYWSDTLGTERRAHIYTPPGYMKDAKNYPVLYLVHGAGDSDDSWTSVGHANYILDNLIASGKAKPMIVVMPFGHTPPRKGEDLLANNDFGNDMLKDLMPYVASHYRTIENADNRAMAGLSMGGAHTIRNGITHPELFHYIGVFSMGLGVGDAGDQVTAYEAQNDAALKKAARDLKLMYYAIGKDDFLYATVAPTRGIFDKYGIKYTYHESKGGHTWANWRQYLNDFAPRLFK